MNIQEVEGEPTEWRRIEFRFPMLAVRTRLFTRVFDKLGSLRSSRLISWVALIIVPVVASIGIYMLLIGLMTLLWTPTVRDASRELGPVVWLLLPGINPILPFLYGWLALICAIAVHEGAHGVIARSLGFKVKSSGLLFFLFVPIGAFVDVDENQIAKAKSKYSLRVMAAGVGGNIFVAMACIFLVLLVVNGLSPVVNGIYLNDVIEGMPAEAAGLLPEDVLVSVDEVAINKYEDFRALFEHKKPGDVVNVTVARGKMWGDRYFTYVNLTDYEGRTFMGVVSGDLTIGETLHFYQEFVPERFIIYLFPPALAPGLVPFSDSLARFYTHVIGEQWPVLANVFFWIWFVNINVAVFNALPIFPLDGGRMFNITLKSMLGRRSSDKLISRITLAVTVTLIFVFLMTALIPFII